MLCCDHFGQFFQRNLDITKMLLKINSKTVTVYDYFWKEKLAQRYRDISFSNSIPGVDALLRFIKQKNGNSYSFSSEIKS